jgi:hypothetical protein
LINLEGSRLEMTELRTEAQDVRTETLEAPGATLAYDTRSAEAESAAPVC